MVLTLASLAPHQTRASTSLTSESTVSAPSLSSPDKQEPRLTLLFSLTPLLSASYEALREKLTLAITEGATGFGCEYTFSALELCQAVLTLPVRLDSQSPKRARSLGLARAPPFPPLLSCSHFPSPFFGLLPLAYLISLSFFYTPHCNTYSRTISISLFLLPNSGIVGKKKRRTGDLEVPLAFAPSVS